MLRGDGQLARPAGVAVKPLQDIVDEDPPVQGAHLHCLDLLPRLEAEHVAGEVAEGTGGVLLKPRDRHRPLSQVELSTKASGRLLPDAAVVGGVPVQPAGPFLTQGPVKARAELHQGLRGAAPGQVAEIPLLNVQRVAGGGIDAHPPEDGQPP